jgi:hypothetical protein
MSECENTIPGTDRICGQDSNSPWHIRFCSEECADRTSQRELAELGITPEMMKSALDGYYECKDMIDKRAPSEQSTGGYDPMQIEKRWQHFWSEIDPTKAGVNEESTDDEEPESRRLV